MFKRLIHGGMIFGMTALAPPALAQTACAPREHIIAQLDARYGEMATAGGLQSSTQMVEIWTAPDTGSWTILVTTAAGVSCVLASGTHWHQQVPRLAAEDSPSLRGIVSGGTSTRYHLRPGRNARRAGACPGDGASDA